MNTKFIVETNVNVVIHIDDPNVIKRYTEKEAVPGIGVVDPPYSDLTTENDILEHFTYNAITNGVIHPNQLDGWADLPDEAGSFYVEDTVIDPFILKQS